MRRIFLVFVFVVALMLGVFIGRAAAQGGDDPQVDPNRVNAIARNLYCPVCENVPLDVCGTAACQQWRQQIADQLAAGMSEQEIYDYFAAQYGDQVLASPPARGLNWLIYLLPPLAILGGATLLYLGYRNWQPANPDGEDDLSEVDDDLQHRLERELDARR